MDSLLTDTLSEQSSRTSTRIIDADGHVAEDQEGILAHLAQPYRDCVNPGRIFPPLDHLHSARAVETPPGRDGRGVIGPDGWIDFLTASSIEWTVLYPTVALSYGKIVSYDYALAVCRAYNDWIADTYLARDDRFRAMAIVPMQDPAEAVRELRRAVGELGMVGAMLPSNGLPEPLGAKAYWPVYAAAEELGCALAVHGGCHDRFGLDHLNMYVPTHALGHPWGIAVSCASILYNGVFDRFPKLRLGFMEGGVAWLLLLLERLHASHETHFQYVPPGEFGLREEVDPARYIKALIAADRFFVGVETEELTMPFAVNVVGSRAFLYSSDFPHEVTLESCRHDIGELEASPELTEGAKADILHANAERFYGAKA